MAASKIKIIRRITFEDFGDNFKDSFLDFNEPSIRMGVAFQQSLKNEDISIILDYMSNEFVEGKMWNGKSTVAIKATDVLDLPLSVVRKISNFFSDPALPS